MDTYPGYGVLISGEWGVGKTHFIKEIINSIKEPNKIIYISLYGLSRTSQIDDEFFKLLHPILGSNVSKFTARLTKLAIKATIKIDIDGDKKDDLSIDAQIPSIDFSKLIEIGKNTVVVIDDLERSSIDHSIILGYINHLIEHEELKVIIIADENKILEKNAEYKSIKEKIIGKTFEITANYESAIESFISLLSSSENQKLLQSHKKSILEVFHVSGYNNLRFLKQFLIEFDLLLTNLINFTKNNDFLNALLKQYLIYCIEHKAGLLQYEDFIEIDTAASPLEINNNNEKSKISVIREKYSNIEEFKYILSSHNWRDIVTKGFIDKNQIETQVSESLFFKSAARKMPAWKMLWEYKYLSDEDFEHAINKAIRILKDKKSNDIGEILHIAACCVHFIENEAIKINMDELDKLVETSLSETINNSTYDFATNSLTCGENTRNSWKEHVYLNYNNPKFYSYSSLADKMLKNKLSSLKKINANRLFSSITDNPDRFINELFVNPESTTHLSESAFLHHIAVKDFIETVISQPPSIRLRIISALHKRYNIGSAYRKLTDEFAWLKKLEKSTNLIIPELKGSSKIFAAEFSRSFFPDTFYRLENAISERKELFPNQDHK